MSRRAVAGGSAVGFSAGWNIADTGAVADDLADAYGTSLGVIGLFTAALFLTHLLMQLPAGRLSDRLGPARVCAAGLAVMAVGNVLASIAPEPALAIGARALLGVGTALGFIGGSDFVRASRGSPFAQGLYGGLATAGGGVALAVVPGARAHARLAHAVRDGDRGRRGRGRDAGGGAPARARPPWGIRPDAAARPRPRQRAPAARRRLRRLVRAERRDRELGRDPARARVRPLERGRRRDRLSDARPRRRLAAARRLDPPPAPGPRACRDRHRGPARRRRDPRAHRRVAGASRSSGRSSSASSPASRSRRRSPAPRRSTPAARPPRSASSTGSAP